MYLGANILAHFLGRNAKKYRKTRKAFNINDRNYRHLGVVQNNKVSAEVGSGATRLMLVLPAVGLSVLGRPVCFITIFLQFLGIKNLQFSKLLTNSDLC